MGSVLLVLFFFIGLPVLGAIWIISAVNSAKRRNESKISAEKDFTVTWKHVGADGLTSLAIDETRMELLFVDRQPKSRDLRTRRLSYRALLSSEVVEDGETITKTSRSSQLGGALVGGVLFGGAGAIVGALTGSKRSAQKVRKVELRIVLNDPASPLFVLSFQDTEHKSGSLVHQIASKAAQEWQARIDVLIRKADATDRETAALPQLQSQVTLSLATEIEKLVTLRQSGALTDAEFAQAKQMLMGASSSLIGAKSNSLGES
jgi:hypothetical protein